MNCKKYFFTLQRFVPMMKINSTSGCYLLLFSVCTVGILAFLVFTFFLKFRFLTNYWFGVLSMHYCRSCCRSWWKPGVLVMPPRICTICSSRPFITIGVHSVMFSLVGGDVVPFANPSVIIHCSHCC